MAGSVRHLNAPATSPSASVPCSRGFRLSSLRWHCLATRAHRSHGSRAAAVLKAHLRQPREQRHFAAKRPGNHRGKRRRHRAADVVKVVVRAERADELVLSSSERGDAARVPCRVVAYSLRASPTR